ncbi:hypothetical protein [Aedoeadaptatus coli]|uniref:hypothetical protein n=1 Tax=Aedoeadaptatus coli TaxID=2058292 RepID=UPI000D55E1C7|nr:hypothetical protein [Peptoniphilus coli]
MRRNQFGILALIQLFVAILAGDILVKQFFFNRDVNMNIFFAVVALVIGLSSSYRSYKKYKEMK